jgi:hypothetical protein
MNGKSKLFYKKTIVSFLWVVSIVLFFIGGYFSNRTNQSRGDSDTKQIGAIGAAESTGLTEINRLKTELEKSTRRNIESEKIISGLRKENREVTKIADSLRSRELHTTQMLDGLITADSQETDALGAIKRSAQNIEAVCEFLEDNGYSR